MEKQEKAFCLVHTFNMAIGENIFSGNQVLAPFQEMEGTLKQRRLDSKSLDHFTPITWVSLMITSSTISCTTFLGTTENNSGAALWDPRNQSSLMTKPNYCVRAQYACEILPLHQLVLHLQPVNYWASDVVQFVQTFNWWVCNCFSQWCSVRGIHGMWCKPISL